MVSRKEASKDSHSIHSERINSPNTMQLSDRFINGVVWFMHAAYPVSPACLVRSICSPASESMLTISSPWVSDIGVYLSIV